MTTKRWFFLLLAVISVALGASAPAVAQAADAKKPNILFIMMCGIHRHRFN